jgi:hypothetical protein
MSAISLFQTSALRLEIKLGDEQSLWRISPWSCLVC